MNTCIKYHSYLKEGCGANMDDEDWNTDLPLCSSTKTNQLFHLTFQLNSTKVTSFQKSFVQCTKRSQQQPGELDIPVCKKGTEETVRVSNNYRKKHLAKLVMAYNSGMASFLPGTLD